MLVILDPQGRSYLHFGGRLYEYPALMKKTPGDGINDFTTLAGLKLQSVYHCCIKAFIYFTSQQLQSFKNCKIIYNRRS